ncbi:MULTISPECIES: M24 family metallopeptidase [Paracoccaceae]|jgi:Xaa-Pro aminopeptidase|uniref:M24 family metallopeptidase n=1 Tax=Rhodobacterales TaxID=204455 RepID=UPI001D0A8BF2|nr:Xaa-Pro peptidase family protein [Boseongicola sp. H5]
MPDFPAEEFQARTEAVQRAMHAQSIDALLVCTEAEMRYFTGFRTPFWQSPTRAWFLIVPARGAPIAVIPGIGADLMATTWVTDIRSFPAPSGGDEGLTLLARALSPFQTIALPMGEEAALRMPLAEFDRLRAGLSASWVDGTPLIKALRMVKSAAEIAVIREICAIGSRAFARAPDLFHAGQPLEDVFRRFRIALLEAGAEDVPYLVGGAGPGGYRDVISPPSDRPLQPGDVLMLDTGATRAGYFCDFDRNWAIGRASAAARQGHAALWQAVERGLAAARPGITCAGLFAAMADGLGDGADIGRMGHGLGMQLTEWPSVAAHDQTVLCAGMVLTLEPSLPLPGGRMMVHEENILITEAGPELLSERTPPDLPVI